MLQLTKNTLFFLLALNLLAPAAARAATIYPGELGTMWDRADAPLFNDTPMNGAGADDQRIRAPIAGTNWHLSSHLSGKPAGAFFVQKTGAEGKTLQSKSLLVATLELDPLRPSATPATADDTGEAVEYTGADAAATHSSPLGPIPAPSLKWLVIGALVALVGISRGTRGIHESV